jgi:hypothetical protein
MTDDMFSLKCEGSLAWCMSRIIVHPEFQAEWTTFLQRVVHKWLQENWPLAHPKKGELIYDPKTSRLLQSVHIMNNEKLIRVFCLEVPKEMWHWVD